MLPAHCSSPTFPTPPFSRPPSLPLSALPRPHQLCSQAELALLTRCYAFPPHKLALASFFYDAPQAGRGEAERGEAERGEAERGEAEKGEAVGGGAVGGEAVRV
ncbi:unnamed protein product [Closterium sp. NIES-53]